MAFYKFSVTVLRSRIALDTGFAICYCKSINSGKGAQAKYRFVWAFLYPWIAAVGSILVLQDKGVLNH